MSENKKVRIWDLPLRLFHWSLATLVAVSLYTGITGGFKEMDYHMLSGYGILALVLFRIIWGFVGGHYARFTQFIRPASIIAYAKQLPARPGIITSGHNPLGALSVIALLLSLGVQATTGLFANDDIFLEGPLAHLVSRDVSNQLSTVHHYNAELLYVLIGLHLTAIAVYELYKGHRLLLPMITGKKNVKGDAEASPDQNVLVELVKGVVVIAICGAAVYYLVNHL